MNTEEWGVTERGFHRPTYVELLDAVEYKARELFGSKANLTVRSPLGAFMRIFAWMLNLLFCLMEETYNSRFVDTAVGASLYNLGKAIGLSLLPAQKASGYVTFSGTPGTTIPTGFLVKTVAGLQYAVLTDGRIEENGTVTLPVQAVDTGADYNVEAGRISQITNPLDGVNGCTNEAAVDGGQDRETDEEFRDRYSKSVDYAGGVNADAISGEILQNVSSIYSAICYENDTDETNELGLPPHSIEVVAYGGLDEEVAKAIYRRKAAGIQTYGGKTIAVLTASGQSIDINFSRPTTVPIYVKISNLQTDGYFPYNGNDLIKEAVINYIGGDTFGGLTIGQDLLYMALPGVILGVSGVVDFDLLISKDGSDYSQDNIEIGTREKAITDTGKVSIEA